MTVQEFFDSLPGNNRVNVVNAVHLSQAVGVFEGRLDPGAKGWLSEWLLSLSRCRKYRRCCVDSIVMSHDESVLVMTAVSLSIIYLDGNAENIWVSVITNQLSLPIGIKIQWLPLPTTTQRQYESLICQQQV